MNEPPSTESRLLTHAMAWSEDTQVNRVRERLIRFANDEFRTLPVRWSFALFRRAHPKGEQPARSVVGWCTLTESAALTGAMIGELPKRLRLQGDQCEVEMMPPTEEQEVMHEPLPGLLLKILKYSNHAIGTVTALSASELPEDGLMFTTFLPGPPKGWPV